GKFMSKVNVNPTEVVINDTVWTVHEGSLEYRNGVIDVDEIKGSCADQFVRIAGKVSHDPEDMLTVELNDIHLDYIFETLKINHVTFGGSATGEFQLADLFSKSPRLSTDRLHVEDMTYNGAKMGDGDIKSSFDSENTGVKLYCDLTQDNGLHTYIDGEIFAADDSLYMVFDANKANVEFMKPFMEAFTDEVHGLVSGHAVLFGNFKTIDLYGDVFAEDFSLKVGYTNCTYTCTDSVHIEPGLIAFNDIKIQDREHNTAKLNGWLRHNAFHDPVFNFTVTDAKNLLCYDITPAMNDDWYGIIYGNGSAIIAGEPGEVRIGVNMESASQSKFTFVLSDAQEASEYNFITFRDRDLKDQPIVAVDTVKSHLDMIPEEVKRLLILKSKKNEQQASMPTHFAIDLQVDITPEAEIILVMDPVGGDRIKAYGSGNLRLNYNSIDDSFVMFGKYVLEKGSYNFTLQDIIIKDFTIRDGSTISFDGDPYNAQLDINAVYSLNANLSDLDDSFSTDRDINRTNVPVNALLKVKGDISEPELAFDLEFPTLSSDAYRKVKSVISTDEMMSRQIIYLLALNRFYTPDYMQSTKTNNEFTSVASSTISSQLSSILGQISENWQISPNFRSDKGDFSDVEVDLALSSQLLNNRLIFNGNFGYRDNTYNTRNSNFIGDFDLEYLLNRKGTIRLKAYNHFNDQNYYVRDAMTTQGVGVVFKHDFDNLFGKKKDSQSVPADTIAPKAIIVPDDNLLIITPRKPEDGDSTNVQ
ncbi:MAG: translocation/assembly module TamB, partial [Muribaculaceae bacterium]|nr:translocation/assembly module TamB [Muribaculaceae bacterium]